MSVLIVNFDCLFRNNCLEVKLKCEHVNYIVLEFLPQWVYIYIYISSDLLMNISSS